MPTAYKLLPSIIILILLISASHIQPRYCVQSVPSKQNPGPKLRVSSASFFYGCIPDKVSWGSNKILMKDNDRCSAADLAPATAAVSGCPGPPILLPDRGKREPEAQAVVPSGRRIPAAVRCPHVPVFVVPVTAAEHAGGSPRRYDRIVAGML
jgi:hypothetical protein